MTAPRFAADDVDLDALYGELSGADLQPLWLLHGLMPASPPIRVVPFRWRGEELRRLAARAGELVTIDRGGDRRVLALSNPGLGGQPFATSTLWGAVQFLAPGESAPSHRHASGALRFVLEGSGVFTGVDGDPVEMRRGDLVLTPSQRWHEHLSLADEPMCWFDALDIPLVTALEAQFFELGDTLLEGERRSRNEERYGHAPGVVPLDGEVVPDHSPLLVYRREGVDRSLAALLADDPLRPHAAIRYVDPTSGRDVMPTLRCEAHRFRGRTCCAPAVGSAVWVVLEGTGTATVGDARFDVAAGDIVVRPSWTHLEVDAPDGMDCFVVSDAPVLEVLGLTRGDARFGDCPCAA